MRVGPNCAELSTLLNEIDVPHCEAVVITDLSTESGTILLNGLPKDAPLSFRPTCQRAWSRSFYRARPETQFLPFLNRASPRVTYS